MLRNRLARAAYRVALGLWNDPGPICPTCRELRLRTGSKADRAARRRALREAWKEGGKGR